MSIIDSSPKPKNVTLNNGASISTSKSRFGGGSLVLNGSNQYANIPDHTDFGFGTGDFTIEMWVYPLDRNNWRTLIAIGTHTNGLLWRIGTGGDQLYFNGTYWDWGASNVPLNTWSHLALVRNNGGIKVFINGTASLSTSDGNTATNLGSSKAVNIGAYNPGSETFNGYIDEVRITKGIGTARYSSNFDVKTLLAPFPSSGTPITPPEVITSLSGVPGGNKITLSWTPPLEDNGDAIIDYSVQYASGEFTSWSDFTHTASSSSSIVVSGLTNGVSYLSRVAPINIAGTGSYVSLESSISPLTPPVLTITSQPLNDYSINSSSAPSISVSGTMSNGDTPTYQWQGYYYDNNTGNTNWYNFTDQTTPIFTLTPNSAYNTYNIYDLQYGSIQVRCIVSGDRVESPITTSVVRWFQIDQQHYPQINWYTNNYNSPSWNGPTNPTSITLGAEENLNLDLYDYGYPDTSWFSGNNTTVKLQISDDNSSWSDLYTEDFRGSLYLYNYQIPTSNGIKYYRIRVISKWPYTTNNGTGSVSHSPPYEWSLTSPSDVVRVTWPLPSQPLNVVADPGDALVDVSWNAPTNSATTVASYTVQYSANGGSWITFGTSSTTSLVVSELFNGTNYVFRVAASNSAGTGSYSSPSPSVTPDLSYATTPGVPTNITGIAGNTKVLLNWVVPSDIGKSVLTDYVVQLSTDDGETWENYVEPTQTPSTSETPTMTPTPTPTPTPPPAFYDFNTQWNTVGFSGSGTLSNKYTAASVAQGSVDGPNGISAKVSAAGTVYITAGSVSTDFMYEIKRNTTTVFTAGDSNGYFTNNFSTSFSVSANDTISIGVDSDQATYTNLQIWWTP